MLAVLAPPRVIVEVAGGPLGPLEAASLTEVVVRQVLSAPGQCELTFADPSPDADVAATCVPGSTLRLRMPNQDQALFDGEVTAIERSYQPDRGRLVRVRAYDRLHRLRKNGGPRVHLDVSASRLASDLASGAGLTVDARADGPSQPRVVQTRQSDLELLLDVCERAGLFIDVDGDTLRLITLEGTGTTVPLVFGGTLIEADIETNGDATLRRVAARGWDVDRLETHEGTATSARTGRSVPAEVAPDAVGGSGERTLLDERASDDDAALSLAQATLDLGVATEVVLRGVALGDPRLRPGCTVDVSGIDPAIAGRYVLTEVRHTIDRARGYLSEISSAPPDPAPRPYATVVTVGEVRSADDPDGRGRVLVVLPSLGDLETAWLEVVSVGAGSNKGLVALPDAGDRVLVLLTHGDPASGVVLGGLYGSDGPFDSGVEDGAVKRFTLRTSAGHIIRLDDEKKTFRIEDPTGSHIEMAQDTVTIHAAVDLRIEAPGKNVKIVAASVDFETG
jgi:phage protein D/phage baseplate assembly protein gpV